MPEVSAEKQQMPEVSAEKQQMPERMPEAKLASLLA
jgi:hypothetical protein